MIDLLGALVARPSRAEADSPLPVLQAISDWLRDHAIPHEWLRDEAGVAIGVCGEIQGGRPGPAYLLDAPADTAPFGDLQAWRHPPDQATIEDGWMFGRGSADSKAGIAVFCHVVADLLPRAPKLAGKLCFVFDADEHTGRFTGIRHYMDMRGSEPVAGVMIGYPGNDRLVIGARGFLRARLIVHGIGAHSGSSGTRGVNAIERARVLLERMVAAPLTSADARFPLPPKLTATAIRGGGSFALVPDRCELELDLRLTPSFEDAAARMHLQAIVARFDADGAAPATAIEWLPGWPAYQLDPATPMVQALAAAASEAFGHSVPSGVVGPSSIANYLSTLGVPATAGLGVTYRNLHAPDECVLLESLHPTFLAYRNALLRLLE
ncbi:MAG: M20 family metallopeptidase [Gammaproteobacteria bacterium]|nr:M20 family metallopeptidase [Gammaproteobacteria bacterium]